MGRLVHHVRAKLQQGGIVYLGKRIKGECAVFRHARHVVVQLGQAGNTAHRAR